MLELKQSFDDYLNAFKKLNINDKRQSIIQEINEISILVAYLAANENISLTALDNQKITNLQNNFENEDEYLEKLLIYIENSKVLLGQYLDMKI